MKITFDNDEQKELFNVLLDNFVSMAEPEPDEIEFINALYEALK